MDSQVDFHEGLVRMKAAALRFRGLCTMLICVCFAVAILFLRLISSLIAG